LSQCLFNPKTKNKKTKEIIFQENLKVEEIRNPNEKKRKRKEKKKN